ncbi:hypothetical protein LTS12_027020 [Elasticomyces elasticus]|nr:hypothetical protein LTS12_027020 [Elasticomyces elasticus]
MKLYIHWIYSSNIDLNVLDWSAVADHTVQLYADQTTLLFRLYIAVDMFLDTVLKNRVTDSLIDRATSGLWNHDVRSLVYVWEHTLPEASLRRLIVDHIMNHKNLDWNPDQRYKIQEPCHHQDSSAAVIRKRIKPSATTKKHHTQTTATVHDDVTYASPSKQDGKRGGEDAEEAEEESMVEEGANGENAVERME